MEWVPSVPGESVGISIDKSPTIPFTNFTHQDNIPNNGSDLFQKFDLDEGSYWQGLNHGFQNILVGSKEGHLPISCHSSEQNSEKFIDDLVQLFSDAKDSFNSLQSTVQNQIQNLKEEIKTQNFEDTTKFDQQLKEVERSLESGFGKIQDMFELLSTSVYDLNLVEQFQGEINNLTTRDFIRRIKDDFEARLCKQRSVVKALNKHWQEKVQELDSMQKDLHELSKSLLNSENNKKTEKSEDRIISKFKDNVRVGSVEDFLCAQKEENGKVIDDNFQRKLIRPENRDFSHVKSMTKEETIKYFKTEMINMRRQHDLLLQEKTEELFRYKREIPKGLLFFKKDKEFESLRKRITDVVSKLDEIRSKKIEVFVVSTDYDEISRLKSKADSLYYENQHLKKVVLDTSKEVKKLLHQLTNKNVKIEKIWGECEEMEIEGRIRDEVYSTILSKVVDEYSKKTESMNEKCRAIMVNCEKERSSLQTEILEKEKMLVLANEECKKSMEVMDEKYRAMLIKCQEERSALETAILEREKALILTNEENKKLKKAVKSFLASTDESQNLVENNLENNLGTCESGSTGSDDNMWCIIRSMLDSSKKISETEAKLSKHINRSENRLECLSNECKPLVQEAASIRKNGVLNQKMLGITRFELHNAETEVNTLGKEVDALLRLLEKIYITISHYSPVLQYHPELLGAFMKTCNLITSLRSNQNAGIKRSRGKQNQQVG